MNTLLRLIWPLLALLMSGLAVGWPARIGWVMIAVILAILANWKQPLSAPLRQQYRERLLLLATAGGLLLFSFLILNMDRTVVRDYALIVAACLIPLGLKIHYKRESLRTAFGFAIEDSHAALIVTALSLLGGLLWHIPAALSAMQIILLTSVIRPLLSGRNEETIPHKSNHWLRVLLTAGLTYGSFIFFFVRHYLPIGYADPTNPTTWQATTVAMVVFATCQMAPLFINPRAQNFGRQLGAAAALVVIAAYAPLLQELFRTGPLATDDWLWSLLGGCLFIALYLLCQRAMQRD